MDQVGFPDIRVFRLQVQDHPASLDSQVQIRVHRDTADLVGNRVTLDFQHQVQEHPDILDSLVQDTQGFLVNQDTPVPEQVVTLVIQEEQP